MDRQARWEASAKTNERLKAKYKIDPPVGCDCPHGWEKLVDALLTDLFKLEGFKPEMVAQIKSKFCGLRVYTDDIPEEIKDNVNKLIATAEDESYKLCEQCGAAAKNTTPAMSGVRLCEECTK